MSGPATSPGLPTATSTNRSASPPSPHANGGSPLTGPSNLPDPATHAYRADLADVALFGRVIASHYAEPLRRSLLKPAPMFEAPGAGEPFALLETGAPFRLLDRTSGWAWGYAADGRVGYVTADAIG